MKLKNALGSFALAATIAAGSAGCVVRAQGHVGAPVGVVEVEEEPPPPRAVVVETRPGFVFIQGRWERGGNQWVWRDGYWERERANMYWEQGRWERRGRGHVWVDGGWRSNSRGPAGGPNVRDHRSESAPPPPPPPSGPVVREHH